MKSPTAEHAEADQSAREQNALPFALPSVSMAKTIALCPAYNKQRLLSEVSAPVCQANLPD